MKLQWNKVTWYSKLIAVLVFLGVFVWAFYLGRQYEEIAGMEATSTGTVVPPAQTPANLVTENIVNSVLFKCDAGKTIQAQFMQNTIGQGSVAIELSDGRDMILPQTLSADGARYARQDESLIFWNKGNTAFIEEGSSTTYQNCVTK